MKRNSVVFIDSTAWLAILDEKNINYQMAREFYEKLLDQNSRLVTSSVVIDETLSSLKMNFGNEFAQKFLEIIDESVLSINLKVDWISRRIRRNAINNFLKTGTSNLQLRHYYINESFKRKKIDIVFSYDQNLKYFDFPVMPQHA
jgi:uncharacterized protein